MSIFVLWLPLALFWKSQQKNILVNGGILSITLLILSFIIGSIQSFQEAILLKNEWTLITLTYNWGAKYTYKLYRFWISWQCWEQYIFHTTSQSREPVINDAYNYYCLNKDGKMLLQKTMGCGTSCCRTYFYNCYHDNWFWLAFLFFETIYAIYRKTLNRKANKFYQSTS